MHRTHKARLRKKTVNTMSKDQTAFMADEGEDPAAAASLSMADVEMASKTGKREGSEVAALMNEEAKPLPELPPPKWTIWDSATFGLTGTSIVFAVLAMVMSGSVVVYVAMGVSLFTASYASYQRTFLRNMDTLREVHNELRQEVNRLQNLNQELSTTNDQLSTQVTNLEGIESQLDGILTTQGKNVSDFVDLVKENGKNVKEMKKLVEGRIVQDLLCTLFKCDRDGDYLIDPEEIDILCLRFENFPGVIFHVDKFKEAMEKRGYGLEAISDIVDDIFDESKKEEEKMFQVEPSDIKVDNVGAIENV